MRNHSRSPSRRVHGCCIVVCLLALNVLFHSGCGSDDGSGGEAVSLQVGYAEVSAPWRLGAKPGQVGTDALPERDRLLIQAVGELLPLLRANQVDPFAHIEGMTEWVLEMLEERVAATEPGDYATLFEAGHGLEEPPVMKAVVLQRGETKIAIVRADLYLGHEQIHRRVAALVEGETGIDRDHIFFVATHNHSGPHAVSPAPGIWTLADAFDPRHFVYLTRAVARAVIEADRDLRPATLRVSSTEFREVQQNIIGPGTIQMRNPDGELETVPVGYPRDYFDPDLATLRFDDPDTGAPLVFLFIFGMHPESLPGGHGILSGEWNTHVENKLRTRTGAPAVWLPGALGDSEPDRGHNHPEHLFMRESFAAMEVMSEIIADAAEKAFHEAGNLPAETEPRLEQVVADIAGVDGFPIPTTAYLGPRFPSVRILHDSSTVRLHAVRIGDALLLGSPGEVTADLSFNIKSRVDREAGNVHQGYQWPTAPEWVNERIRRNFTEDEVEPEQGAPIPIVVSHTNGYMGYIVSAWEYENRAHYRQEMTAFGPETADHVASAFVGMVRELEGGPGFEVEPPAWRELDLEGVERIQTFLADLDAEVTAMARALPASDPGAVGTVVVEPPAVAEATSAVRFSWLGGTNDMEPPRMAVERQTTNGWETIARGPSKDVFLLFEPPDRWTAEWRDAAAEAGASLRFRIEGTYRGTVPGASEPDPIWDPDGANAAYEVVSAPFQVDG